MDLQLLVAINLMAVSAMAIGMTIIYGRWRGGESWVLAHGIVLAIGALCFWLWPARVGVWVAIVFVPLIVVPAILARLQQRETLLGRNDVAARYGGWMALMHPSPANRVQAALLAAIATSDETDTRTLTALAEQVPQQYRPIVLAQAARMRNDWSEVLALSDQAQEAPAIMRPMQVRALGELGRRGDMVRSYIAAGDVLSGVNQALTRLFVLAFGGRPDGVHVLLTTSLAHLPEETKAYWTGLAALNTRSERSQGELMLRTLAERAEKPATRSAAKRQLLSASAGPPEPLPPDAVSALDVLEQRTLQTALARGEGWRTVPLTIGLIAVNLAVFAAEVYSGGSEDTETLLALGALWPPDVIAEGEWWRLITASFLHFGPLHLATNMFVLWVLGRQLEPLIGTARMAGVYAIGGLASSAFVLWLMVAGHTGYGLLVGASGAIFALVGAEAGVLIARWFRDRASFDARNLTSLAMMLGLQVAIDMSLPNVSFAAHASGFVTGLALMLAGSYVMAFLNSRKFTAGPRS